MTWESAGRATCTEGRRSSTHCIWTEKATGPSAAVRTILPQTSASIFILAGFVGFAVQVLVACSVA